MTAASCGSATCEGVPASERARQICSAAPPPSQPPGTGRCGSRTAAADLSADRPRAASGPDVAAPRSEGAPSRRERPPPPPRTAKPGQAATATVDATAAERRLLSQVANSQEQQNQKQQQQQEDRQLQNQQQKKQQQPQRPPSAPLQAVLQRIRYFEAPREQTYGSPNAPLSQPPNVARPRPSSLALSSKAASPSPTAFAAPLASFYRPPAVAAGSRCSGKVCSAGEASAAVRSEAECEVVRFAALRSCFEKSRLSCGPQADDEYQRPNDRVGCGDRPSAFSRISPCCGSTGDSCNVRPPLRSFVEALVGERASGAQPVRGEQRQPPLSSEFAAAVGSGGGSCCCSSASSSYVGGESVDGDLDANADFPGASVSSSSSVTSDGESLMAVSDFACRAPADRQGPIDDEDSMPSGLAGYSPLVECATLGGCDKAVEGSSRRGNDGHDFGNAVAAAAAEDDEDDDCEARDRCGGGDGGLDLDVNSASCGYFYDDEFETLADDFSGHCRESGVPREATADAFFQDVGHYKGVCGDNGDGDDDDDDDPLRGYASAFENALQIITSSGGGSDSSSSHSSSSSCCRYEADADDEACARRLCAAAEAAVSPENYTLAFGAAAAALSGSSATLERAFGGCCDGSRASAAAAAYGCSLMQPPAAAAAVAPGSEAAAETTVAGTPRSARDHLRREALTRLRHRVVKHEPSTQSGAAAGARRPPPPPPPPRPQRTAQTKGEVDGTSEDATRRRQEGRVASETERPHGAASGGCGGFLPKEQSPSVGYATPRRCCVSLTDITVPPPPPSPPPPSPPPPPPPSAQRMRSTSPICCYRCQSVASAERRRQSDCSSGGARHPDGRAGSCCCRRDAIAAELSASEPLQRGQQRQCASESRHSRLCSDGRQALPDVTFLRRDKQLICSTVWWACLSEEPTFCRAATDASHRQFAGVDARGGATPPLASPLCTYAVVYQSSIASERKYQMALVRRLLGDDRDGGDLASPGGGCYRADSSSGIATGSSEAAAAIKDPQAVHHRTSPDGCHRRRSSDSPHVEMKGFLAGYASDERFPGVSRFADAIDELLTLTQTRLTSEETEARLVEALRELSLALESALSAGIRACRVTVLAFGKFASRADVWDVVEDSTASVSGDPARPFGTVIAQVKRMDAALPANLRFCMFVCGLLNHRCLDFWLQLLRHNQSLLDKYYDDASLLRCATDEHRTVYTALLAAAARLSLCSFDFDLESLMRRFVEHLDNTAGYRRFFRQEDQPVQQQQPSAQFYV